MLKAAIAAACAGLVLASGLAFAGPMVPGQSHCVSSLQCHGGTFCLTPAGACWARGVCAGTRHLCLPSAPKVCGCDRRTYRNECAALAARMNVLHTGAC